MKYDAWDDLQNTDTSRFTATVTPPPHTHTHRTNAPHRGKKEKRERESCHPLPPLLLDHHYKHPHHYRHR